MKKISALAIFLIACGIAPVSPTPPEDQPTCVVINFEDGTPSRWGWDFYRFEFDWVFDPDIIAELDSGRVVWKTSEVYFQWFQPIKNPDSSFHFFHDFRSIQLSAAGRVRLTFVGDDFDTLRIDTTLSTSQPFTLFVPDSLFKGTTQVHAFGEVPLDSSGEGLKVDDVNVCSIPN